MQAITVGLDIAKSIFQVHGVDADGQVVVRRQYEAFKNLCLSRSNGLKILAVELGESQNVPVDEVSVRCSTK
jgi:hypothetical protein